jgi:hypothetical protein
MDDMTYLDGALKNQAKVAIRAITGISGWYKKLSYRYSYVGESSELDMHTFDLLAKHDGQVWALNVWQRLDNQGKSSFDISAEPYEPDTYVDYAKALQAAINSCPIPQ